MLDMPMRILREKLPFYHHISCLPENSVAFQVLKTQEEFQLPSLRQEISSFLSKFEVLDVKSFTKDKWKVFVKRSIGEFNRDHILNKLMTYKKLDFISIASEDFKIKDYFFNLNLDESRAMFRARSLTMTSCSTHYPSNPEFVRNMFECTERCGSVDSILHWETSNCYASLKKSGRMNDKELCRFYLDVIQQRMQNIGMNGDLIRPDI